MKSLVIKRSVVLAGHKTSVSLEDAFWRSVKELAAARGVSLSVLLTAIGSEHHHSNLSSGIRLFVLNHYRGQSNISDMVRSIPLPSGRAHHPSPSLIPDAEH
jgi:predicted DNA-binding ribbon-helix-helix protein